MQLVGSLYVATQATEAMANRLLVPKPGDRLNIWPIGNGVCGAQSLRLPLSRSGLGVLSGDFGEMHISIDRLFICGEGDACGGSKVIYEFR